MSQISTLHVIYTVYVCVDNDFNKNRIWVLYRKNQGEFLCLIFIRWDSLIYINSTCSMKSFLNSKGVYRLSVLAGQAVECRIKHLHTAKHYVQQIGAYFSPICPEHKTMWLWTRNSRKLLIYGSKVISVQEGFDYRGYSYSQML